MNKSKYLWLALLELLRITALFLLIILLLNPELNTGKNFLLLWLGALLFVFPALFTGIYLKPELEYPLIKIIFFGKIVPTLINLFFFLVFFGFFYFLFNFRPEFFLTLSAETIDLLSGTIFWITPLTRLLTLLIFIIDLFFCFYLLSLIGKQPEVEQKNDEPDKVLPDMQATQVEEE